MTDDTSSRLEPDEEPEVLWALDTADAIRRTLQSSQMRPAFRARLRAQLLDAHPQVVPAARPEPEPALEPEPAPEPPPAPVIALRPGTRPRLTRPRLVALVGVAAAVLALVGAVLVRQLPNRSGSLLPVTVTAQSDAAGTVSTDPGRPLRLQFSRPLDHRTAEAALHLTPATNVRLSWQANTLTVTPDHGFTPNQAYQLTIGHTAARTALGAPLAADIHLGFGTAPVPGAGHPAGPAVPLRPAQVAPADDDSEAVISRTGALLLTGARPSPATDQHTGFVRLENGTAFKISDATAAICLSQSTNSIAYLSPAGQRPEIVFGGAAATPQRQFPATVDDGSPLGWIGDAEVTFVSGGRLTAMNRTGQVRVLSQVPVDAAHDTLVLSTGGRYAYVKPAARATGQIVDLQTGKAHPLPAVTGAPAFSTDGATVVWVDTTGSAPRLAVTASGGGPVLHAPLPVGAGDRLSDLAVAPGAGRFVYSVTHADGSSELRLAALPSGQTLASSAGAGASPNWSPTGQQFTVLVHGPAGPQIDLVTVPGNALDSGAAFEATASAFAQAQVGGDAGAQQDLAAAGVSLPPTRPVTRATVLWVQQAADGTATARVRLSVDPPAGPSTVQQAEETLTLGPGATGAPPVVRGVALGPFTAAPSGPQLVGLDTDAKPGTALLSFDSDLDPASVGAGAVTLTTTNGAPLPATVTYDAATRTVAVHPATPPTTAVVVRVSGGLRDSAGHGPAEPLRIPTTLSA